jgi:hypothetical protein
MKFDTDLLSKIFSTLEISGNKDFGLDVRLINEKIDEANKALQDLGLRIELQSVNESFPVDGRLVALSAGTKLFFKNR